MKEIKKLIKSFRNAYKGFEFSVKNERNLRIHLAFVFYVLIFSFLAKLSATELSLVLMCFSIVISAELINTSIEILCDKESTGYNDFIRRAKDVAASAVLISAIFSVVVGLVIFAPKLLVIANNLNIFNVIALLLSLIFTIFLVFKRR